MGLKVDTEIGYTSVPLTGNNEFDTFMVHFFNRVCGINDKIGFLNEDNVNGELTDTIDHSQFTNVTANQHHNQTHEIDGSDHSSTAPLSEAKGGTGEILFETAFDAVHDAIAGSHAVLQQATDPTDSSSSGVSVTTADADATYGTPERDLINELKADVNTLVSDVNAIAGKLNTLLANLRTAGLIA